MKVAMGNAQALSMKNCQNSFCKQTVCACADITNKLQRAKGGCLGTGKPMKDAVSCEKLREDANNL